MQMPRIRSRFEMASGNAEVAHFGTVPVSSSRIEVEDFVLGTDALFAREKMRRDHWDLQREKHEE
jgi:hypothetical protein